MPQSSPWIKTDSGHLVNLAEWGHVVIEAEAGGETFAIVAMDGEHDNPRARCVLRAGLTHTAAQAVLTTISDQVGGAAV